MKPTRARWLFNSTPWRTMPPICRARTPETAPAGRPRESLSFAPPSITPIGKRLPHPNPALPTRHEDYSGNPATFVTVEGAHRQLSVTARSVVDTTAPQLPEAPGTPSWETVRDLAHGPGNGLGTEPVEFTFSSPQ